MLKQLSMRKFLTVVGALIAVALSVTSYWYFEKISDPEPLTRQEAGDAIRRTLLGLYSYNALGELPSSFIAGSRESQLYSWRLEVCEFGTPLDDYYVFDLPWDSKRSRAFWNKGAFWTMTFAKPEEDNWRYETKIMALVGPGTTHDWIQHNESSIWEVEEDTIVLVEVADSGIHWMQPGDIDIRTVPREINPDQGLGISGNYPGGFLVGFADGAVWFLRETTPFEELAKFFTVESAEVHDREDVLSKYMITRRDGFRPPRDEADP